MDHLEEILTPKQQEGKLRNRDEEEIKMTWVAGNHYFAYWKNLEPSGSCSLAQVFLHILISRWAHLGPNLSPVTKGEHTHQATTLHVHSSHWKLPIMVRILLQGLYLGGFASEILISITQKTCNVSHVCKYEQCHSAFYVYTISGDKVNFITLHTTLSHTVVISVISDVFDSNMAVILFVSFWKIGFLKGTVTER